MVHKIVMAETRRIVSAIAPVRAFARDRSGAVAVIFALTLPILIGAMAMATEISYWDLHHRAMRNAADAAVMAAATNGGSNFDAEAKAVAATYGFADGAGNVTVTVTNPATATGCATSCYSVTISDAVPLFLSQVVGYKGDATVGNRPATTIAATAVATSGNSFCILALASSGAEGIRTNGAPNANLAGCNVMSNTTATCNGSNLNAAAGFAHGTDNGCGIAQNSNQSVAADPYSTTAANLPADTCGSFPQEPSNKNSPPLPSTNLWSGNYTLSGNNVLCGDQQLTANTTISAPSGAVLVIENGQLDTNGFTFSGANITVVFSGSNNASYQHIPTGGGILDIAAPTTGPWKWMAMYQDPALTTNVDISAAGNSPTWNINGVVYLPHSSVTLSGAVSKFSSGPSPSCMALVVDNVTINGTGAIFANDTQCVNSGFISPSDGNRGKLVN